jgi:glycosyltransferase involved in cell wall biosynthesis
VIFVSFGATGVLVRGCGLPAVVDVVGGIKYSVLDGSTGYLVPPNDPLALADRLNEICSSRRLAERLSSVAVRRAYALFRWERVAQSLAVLYGDVRLSASEPVRTRAVAAPLAGVVAAA